jgi:peptidoglycan/LPS O-acetylase OafA/YrhL
MTKLFKIDYKEKERVFGLDLLRTIAILIVVLGHGDIIVRSNFQNFINFWIVDGVDLFFVLSGFLIGSIIIKSFEKYGINRNTIIIFWKRRWFRTLPNYYLIVFLCLILTFIITKSRQGFSTDYILFVQNFRKPHPDFFPVAWSLAIEEWFYLLFPISIIIIKKIIPNLILKRIVLIAVVIFLLIPLMYRIIKFMSFPINENADSLWDILFRKTVITRLDTIVFGVLGAYLNYYYSKFWTKFKYIKFLLGIVFIYVAQYKIRTGILFFTLNFDVLSFGILLLIPLLNSFKTTYKFIAIPVTYISISSYSMYLIHHSLILIPILSYVKYFSRFNAIFFYLLYLTSTILISIIIYKYFEKPIMDLREKKYIF